MIYKKSPSILIYRWNVDDNCAFPFTKKNAMTEGGGGGEKKFKFTSHITKTKQIYTKAL